LLSQSKRPRERTNSNADAKQEASLQVVMDMIKTFFVEKEVSSEKRTERKRRDKGKVMKGYIDIQNKRLKIEEMNALARAKEVANNQRN
jgi:hypothetical protein